MSEGANGPVDFHAMDESAADPNVMYGLYGQVQVNRDGGQTWRIAGTPPADTFGLAASAGKPGAVYAATRGGLMQSRDALGLPPSSPSENMTRTSLSRERSAMESLRLPDRLPDNWRRIILDHVARPNFCPRAMWADLRDTPPVYDPPSQRHGAER